MKIRKEFRLLLLGGNSSGDTRPKYAAYRAVPYVLFKRVKLLAELQK